MKLAAPSALGTGRRGGFSSVLVNASRPDSLRLDPHAFLLPYSLTRTVPPPNPGMPPLSSLSSGMR